MTTRLMAMLLLGACSFGVDGDFAVTEAGLVGVRSLSMSELDVDTTTVSTRSSDGIDLIVRFEQAGREGELWIPAPRGPLALGSGGVGVLRFMEPEGWSEPRTVRLSRTSIRPTNDAYTNLVTLELLSAGPRKAQLEAPGAEETAEGSSVPESQSVPEESVGELVLSVTNGHC